MYKKLLALATFTGTIIGVGLFGLPYVTAQVGFIPMIFYFLILGPVIIVMHLIYGEISLRTKENHRLPGYNRIYLNKKWLEVTSYITTIIGLTGSLLAYILVGGEFLANLLSPYWGGDTILYVTGFFLLGFIIIYFGTGPVSKTEFFSLGIFFTVLAILLIKILPHLNPTYFTISHLNFYNFFLPYGVILFSLDGMAVIPEMKEILKNQEKSLKNLIILGSIIPIITYLIFITIVYGVTGPNTTPEAMVGLNAALGNGVAKLGFVFGIIATFTSFLTLGITLKKEFHYDRGLPAWLAAILACFPAYIIYVLGLNNFIGIIGFIGAVALAIDIIVIMAIYLKAKEKSQRRPAYSINLSKTWIVVLTVLFLIGIGVEIFNLII